MTKKTTAKTGEKKNTKASQQKNPSQKGSKKPEKEVKAEKEEVKKEVQEEKRAKKTDKEIIAELNDKYLRLAAEFDNYRRRTLKEKMELSKSAGEDILVNILPVMDDFERGLVTIDQAKDINAIKEGIQLIHNKFKEFLKQRGVKEIVAKEKEFDTDLHEAITKIPAPNKKLKGKVVDVVEKGYYLNEKVIRFSKVVIGE